MWIIVINCLSFFTMSIKNNLQVMSKLFAEKIEHLQNITKNMTSSSMYYDFTLTPKFAAMFAQLLENFKKLRNSIWKYSFQNYQAITSLLFIIIINIIYPSDWVGNLFTNYIIFATRNKNLGTFRNEPKNTCWISFISHNFNSLPQILKV